jgi:hypothetical protein
MYIHLHLFTVTEDTNLKVIAFVMDNATNNDTMVEYFGLKCTQHDISFSERNARLRCLPHTIHLAALKVMYLNQKLFMSTYYHTYLKLLEAIGAVSKASPQEPYQDSATASVDQEFDDEAVSQEDGIDDEADGVAMKSAVGKVYFLLLSNY